MLDHRHNDEELVRLLEELIVLGKEQGFLTPAQLDRVPLPPEPPWAWALVGASFESMGIPIEGDDDQRPWIAILPTAREMLAISTAIQAARTALKRPSLDVEFFRDLIDRRRESLEQLLAMPAHETGPLGNQDMRRRLQEELADLTAATRRLAEGSYGRCAHCDQPIEYAVLQQVPAKMYCSVQCERLAAAVHAELDRAAAEVPPPPSSNDLRDIRNMMGPAPVRWPLCFSCNPGRQVWRARLHWYTPPERRDYLEHPFLRSVAGLVLKHRWPGGQFLLFPDHVEDSGGSVIWEWS